MELTIKLNLLDLADAEAQLAQAQKVIQTMRGVDVPSVPVSEAAVNTEFLSELLSLRTAEDQAENSYAPMKEDSHAAKVFGDILVRIEKNGEATLQDIADDWGVDRKTIRGHFLNGMRVLKHRQQSPPFDGAWVPERRCVVYTAKND